MGEKGGKHIKGLVTYEEKEIVNSGDLIYYNNIYDRNIMYLF